MFGVCSKNLKAAVPQVLEELRSEFKPAIKHVINVFEESLEEGKPVHAVHSDKLTDCGIVLYLKYKAKLLFLFVCFMITMLQSCNQFTRYFLAASIIWQLGSRMQ